MIQSIPYNMISSDIFTPDNLRDLIPKLALKTSQLPDHDLTHYHIRPAYVNDTLSVVIDIPLINRDKSATLFQVTKYPLFINGTKYVSSCAPEFVAIYDHTSNFNLLSREEYLACSSPRGRCLVTLPRLSDSTDSCIARAFFSFHNAYVHQAPIIRSNSVANVNFADDSATFTRASTANKIRSNAGAGKNVGFIDVHEHDEPPTKRQVPPFKL
jgi:hypothetical protein